MDYADEVLIRYIFIFLRRVSMRPALFYLGIDWNHNQRFYSQVTLHNASKEKIFFAVLIIKNIIFFISAILLGKHPDVTKEFFTNVRHIPCGAAPLSASDVMAVLEKGNVSEIIYIINFTKVKYVVVSRKNRNKCYLIFSFIHSGIEAKRGDEFRHSARNASRMR